MTLHEPTSEDAEPRDGALTPAVVAPTPMAETPESTAGLGDIWLLEDGIYSAHLQILPADEVDADTEAAGQRTWTQRFAAMRDNQLTSIAPVWHRVLRSSLLLSALVIATVVIVFVGIFVATRIGGTIHPTVPASSVDRKANQDGVVIVPSGQNAQPTPAPSDYLIGVWTTQSNPRAGAVAQVFVRLTYQEHPLANTSVSLDVTIGGFTRTYPSAITDSYGLAIFQVSLAGASANRPVYLTGRYKISSGLDVESNVIIVPE
ncbi:MAG TPA: hypothetical protein VF807_12685 [Ktedonobacterales bacterium]